MSSTAVKARAGQLRFCCGDSLNFTEKPSVPSVPIQRIVPPSFHYLANLRPVRAVCRFQPLTARHARLRGRRTNRTCHEPHRRAALMMKHGSKPTPCAFPRARASDRTNSVARRVQKAFRNARLSTAGARKQQSPRKYRPNALCPRVRTQQPSRDWSVKRPVHLEGSRPVAVTREFAPITVRQPVSHDAQQLARRHIAKHELRRG